MPSPQKLVLFTIIAIAVTLVGTQANGDQRTQYNPTYRPLAQRFVLSLRLHHRQPAGQLGLQRQRRQRRHHVYRPQRQREHGDPLRLRHRDQHGRQRLSGRTGRRRPVLQRGHRRRQLHRRAVQLPVQRHEQPDRQRVGLFPSGFTASSIAQKSDIFSLWNQNGGTRPGRAASATSRRRSVG